MQRVSNPSRGCGRLKPGGFYAGGDMSPDGRLKAWSWVLSTHLEGERNVVVELPARQMRVINLPQTIAQGTLVDAFEDQPELPEGALRKLPVRALADHVGASYYTAWGFAQEVMAYGPSRRIPEHIAREIAGFVPMPIAFTHATIPVVAIEAEGDLRQWASEVARAQERTLLTPTYYQEKWGLYRGDYVGADHWMTDILHAIHVASEGKDRSFRRIMPAPLHDDVLEVEQLYGVSWITRVHYVTTGEEDEARLDDLREAGITPVEAEDD